MTFLKTVLVTGLTLFSAGGFAGEAKKAKTVPVDQAMKKGVIVMTKDGYYETPKGIEELKSKMSPEEFEKFSKFREKMKSQAKEKYKAQHEGKEWTQEAGKKALVAKHDRLVKDKELADSKSAKGKNKKAASAEEKLDGDDVPKEVTFSKKKDTSGRKPASTELKKTAD